MKTVAYLDAIKSRHGLKSDYQLGKFMGWSFSTISGYRRRGREMGDEHCLQVAEALHLDAGQVLADIQAARAKSPETRKAWEGVARAFRGAAAVLLAIIAVAALLVASPGQAVAGAQGASERLLNRSIHYTHYQMGTAWAPGPNYLPTLEL